MDRMSISIPEHLAGFVKAKVASGRYSDASDVVRDALRRMEDAEQVEAELGDATAEESWNRMTLERLSEIRIKVLEGIGDIEEGRYTEFEGEEGLKQFAAEVKARGRELLLARKAELAKAEG